MTNSITSQAFHKETGSGPARSHFVHSTAHMTCGYKLGGLHQPRLTAIQTIEQHILGEHALTRSEAFDLNDLLQPPDAGTVQDDESSHTGSLVSTQCSITFYGSWCTGGRSGRQRTTIK